MSASRTIRIFLSSTFRDFGEERDLLVRKVFPALRARLKDRFVELVDVDLRWGITVEEAERGEVLPICLAEIDRSRPYFIGMLGERYGWIPPQEGYAPDLLERQPWLKKHQGGKSVTELEILHGVLKNKRMKSRAFFYFRSPAYARSKGGHYVPDSTEDRQRQLDLKRRIKDSGYSVTGYRDPEALAKRMERDLWKLLDAEFPATDVPDAFERESMRHEAYAAPRRRLYLGGDTYIHALNALIKKNANRILITGQSGGGKSALLANALAKHRGAKTHLLDHYLGSSSDAADAVALVRRVIEYIRRVTGNTDPVAADTEELFDSVSTWLAIASAFAKKNKTRWIFVFDALNNLNGYRNLKWFPAYLPERIQIVVSCLEGEVKETLKTKGAWDSLFVEPLDPKGQRQLLTEYLKRFNKSLPADLLNQALGHPLANNPLWLKTLAEELRLFGSHEELSNRLNILLGPPKGKDKNEPPTVDDLFEHVLQRIEGDQGRKLLRDALTAIWASRAGLSEPELLEILAPHNVTAGKTQKANKLPPAQWAPVRNALDEMLLESGGRIIFGHDYVKVAVKDRYLPRESLQRNAHKRLAEHFAKRKVDERVAEELPLGPWFRAASADDRRAEEEPWQWLAARDWRSLKACMSDAAVFAAFGKRGGAAEMQPYWRQLEQHAGVNMAQTCLRAWRRWDLPANDAASAQLTLDLANLLLFVSHYAAAFKLASRSVAMLVAHHGERHVATHKARNILGKILTGQSRYAAAVAQHQRVLDAYPRVASGRGEKAAIYFDALNDMAVNTYYLGHFEESLPSFEAVLAFRRANLGPTHRLSFLVANNLANAHSEIGRYDQALAVHSENLAAARRVLGQACPEVALFLANHAAALERSGNLEDAARQYQLSIDVYDAIFGRRCVDILLPLGNLGLLRQQQGQGALALSLQTEALRIARAVLGNQHRETVRALLNLAAVTEEASARRALLEEGYAVARQVLGDHMFTMSAVGQLGRLTHEEGDNETGEQLLLEAHSMAERLLPSTHYHVLANKFGLGRFYYDQGDDEQALRWLQECLRLQSGLTGAPVTTLPDVCLMLSWIHESRGDYAQAREVLQRSLAQLVATDGPYSSKLIAQLSSLADVEVSAGNFDAAQAVYKKALAIAEATAEFDVGEHCELLYSLGDLLEKHVSAAEALPVYEKCLRLAEGLHGAESDKLVNILVILAAVRELVGELAAALSARERVQRIFSTFEDISEDRVEQREVNSRALATLQLAVGTTSVAPVGQPPRRGPA